MKLRLIAMVLATAAAGCSGGGLRADRDLGIPDAGQIDPADAPGEEQVSPVDTGEEPDADPDAGPPVDDAGPDLVEDVGVGDHPDAPDGRPGDGPVDRGPFALLDAGPEPTVPPICYDDVSPPDRFSGFYIPFCQTGVQWPDAIIPTCWSEESSRRPDFETVSRSVESFVRESFNRPTRINFLGWKVCDSTPPVILPDGSPARGRLVLSLTDETTSGANLGFGAGGDRHIVFGVRSGSFQLEIIESFIRILGLTYRTGVRQISPNTLLWNETGGLQVFYGRRPGGAILGREARCLEARMATSDPDAGAPAQTSGSLHVNECLNDRWQDWQFDYDGSVHLIGRPDVVLGADTTNATVRLETRRMPAPEQTWSIKRAFMLTEGLKCIGVPDGSFFEGQSIISTTCNGSPGQEWEIDLLNGKIVHGDFCIGVVDGLATAGNTLQVQRCRPTFEQMFNFRSTNQIHFYGLCFNVFKGTLDDGSVLGLWPCQNVRHLGNENFYFNGQIQNGDMCLEMPSDRSSSAVTLKTCRASDPQRWDVHMRTVGP